MERRKMTWRRREVLKRPSKMLSWKVRVIRSSMYRLKRDARSQAAAIINSSIHAVPGIAAMNGAATRDSAPITVVYAAS